MCDHILNLFMEIKHLEAVINCLEANLFNKKVNTPVR